MPGRYSRPLTPKEFLQFLDCQWRCTSVKHGVAVRAHRPEVIHRVHGVAFTMGAEWPQVVDVNKALTHLAVALAKVEPTDSAPGSPVVDTGLSRSGISLVAVNLNSSTLSFSEQLEAILLGRHPGSDWSCNKGYVRGRVPSNLLVALKKPSNPHQMFVGLSVLPVRVDHGALDGSGTGLDYDLGAHG